MTAGQMKPKGFTYKQENPKSQEPQESEESPTYTDWTESCQLANRPQTEEEKYGGKYYDFINTFRSKF